MLEKLGQIAGLMKNLPKIKEEMDRLQQKLGQITADGDAGGGMVKVLVTCKHEVKRVAIDPSLLKDDKEMLEDLVAAAMNDAARRAEAAVQEKMSSITGGLGLPPGLKLPF